MSVKTTRPGTKLAEAKGKPHPQAPVMPAKASGRISSGWIAAGGCAAALITALMAYWPALHGRFVFDDLYMRFAQPHPERDPLWAWVIGSRPLVNFTYFVNYQMDGANPFGYHLFNLLFHTLAALLVFLIVRKILEMASLAVSGPANLGARRRTLFAAFCGAIFLLHPVQTEAVAYVAQRSENLSVMLAFAAWACFLYRPTTDIRFPSVLAVVLLFGASVACKEHVAVLPLVILLTDYYWNPGFSFGGVRRNWRLYGTLLVASMAGAAFLYSYLAHEPTVGFHMKEFTWYQYLFTQCRVLFLYLRLFVLPFGQTVDYATPLSHTPLEHGAIFGMIVLAGAAAASFIWRKRFPLASYGFFVALVFFLPTSSIMPVRDLAAERRLYLPMIGMLLMTTEILVRIRWNDRRLAAVLGAVVLAAGILTWHRSFVWTNSLALWSDTVQKSPGKARAHFGLASADLNAGRYGEAAQQYELAKGLDFTPDGLFYSNWALALDGAGRTGEAIEMGRKGVRLYPNAATYSHLARILAHDGYPPEIQEAVDLLDKAEKADASYEPLYIERGNILMQVGLGRHMPEAAWKPYACAAFQKAAELDSRDPSAYKGLGVLGCPVPR